MRAWLAGGVCVTLLCACVLVAHASPSAVDEWHEAFVNEGASAGARGLLDWDSKVGNECTQHSQEIKCGRRLACIGETCNYCRVNEDCNNSNLICSQGATYEENKCKHKPLFPHFHANDALATFFLFLGGIVAAGGGIGGGGLFVPLLIVVARFSPHAAIPLSKAMIFGGSIANFLFNAVKRHPTADRPLISFETALIMEPLTLGGTIIGVFFNIVFPSWLIVLCLVLLLGSTTRRTWRKGVKVWKKESVNTPDDGINRLVQRYLRWRGKPPAVGGGHVTLEENGLEMSETTPLEAAGASTPMPGADSESGSEDGGADGGDAAERGHAPRRQNPALRRIFERERNTPWARVLALGLVWVSVFALSMLKGGHGASGVVPMCSPAYWVITVLAFPWLFFITYRIGKMLMADHQEKVGCGYEFQEGDIQWTRRATIRNPTLCAVAGVAAGMLGIGGGMVKGPLLLELGMLPQVTSATSAFMILFTSSSTVMQFLIMDRLQRDYAAWFAFIGFWATVVGQKGMNVVVKKYNKTSYVIFCIAIVIGFSTVMMGITGIMQSVQDAKEGTMGFHSLCE